MAKPVVIAHRGASGYRPENTLAAFEFGIQQGADGIEFDLVATKDDHLVIRHENALSSTTNISRLPEFAKHQRVGIVEDVKVTDWFSEDFSLDEIKKLRAIERIPDLRPGSAKFDEQFSIPALNEVLNSEFLSHKTMVVEIKRGSHTEKLSLHIGELAAQEILKSKVYEHNVNLIIESFDHEILMGAKKSMEALNLEAKYFFALDDTKLAEVDIVKLSMGLDGLAISMPMLFSSDSWVRAAHGVGLDIWVYTARAEQAQTSIEEYYEHIIQTGVDGIFADQPDLLARVLADRG
jgi:glycerophosphoryl diester phosphodiesterase